MRISDWSSDVCSSDLVGIPDRRYAMFGHGFDRDPRRTHMKIDRRHTPRLGEAEKWPGHQILGVTGSDIPRHRPEQVELGALRETRGCKTRHGIQARKSVVKGKRVSVRVDRGGRRIIKKKTYQ